MRARVTQALYERRFDDAIALIERKLGSMKVDDSTDKRRKFFVAELAYCQQWAGHLTEAHATFARAIEAIKPTPDAVVPLNYGLSFWLAHAYAGLGEKEKALTQAKRAVSDYSDDSLTKPNAEVALAQIEAVFGDFDSAVAALPHLLEVPSGITRADLRLDPLWDPLRSDPRFKKICDEKAL